MKPHPPIPALDAAAAAAALKQAHPDRDSWDVIDAASARLPQEGATSAHLAQALKELGDAWQDMGDDYLAETADILGSTLAGIEAEHASAAARKSASPPRPNTPRP